MDNMTRTLRSLQTPVPEAGGMEIDRERWTLKGGNQSPSAEDESGLTAQSAVRPSD